jgi:hypothetical protein
MHLRDMWQRITTTRYTRTLEAEVVRLRAENRGLLNSILGIAGIPPIVVTPADFATEAAIMDHIKSASPANKAPQHAPQTAPLDSVPALPRPDKPSSSAPARVHFKTESGASRRPGGIPHANSPRVGRFNGQAQHNASPMRRRSWQQINRMLEFESARKKPQET